MATYSLAITGLRADLPQTIKTTKLPDAMPTVAADPNTEHVTATSGGMAYAMSQGLQLLCKGPDGGLRLYQLDAERSTPANPVLLAVGP